MRGAFDDGEFEQPRPGRDTELTLGAGTLLLIFFGLVLVCGLCFGLGYAVGHRGAPLQLIGGQQSASGTQPSPQSAGSVAKPSATTQAPAAPAQSAASQPTASDLPQSTAAVTMPVGSGQNANPTAQAATLNGQPQVRPALSAAANAPQAAQHTSAQQVQPTAMPAAIPLMVQIAAVSHQEDADVLSSALRRRGYAVIARREPSDNMIHVRVGPFNTRDEANRWRMKLLNDGYNAMIQP